MSSFQTQSQWENSSSVSEFQIDLEPDHESGLKKKTGQNNKKALIIAGSATAIVIAVLLSVYMFARPIEGIWVRQTDTNYTVAGMTVEVRRNGRALEGVIISMPEGAEAFEVGQIKWFNIRKVGFGRYSFQDLTHSDSSGSYYYHRESDILAVSSGGKNLSIITSQPDQKGHYQVWLKNK